MACHSGQSGVGSSPLTRGKLSNGLRSPSRPRLIPAHAGKTHTHDVMQTTHTAHPRSRGENEYGFAVADKDSGSSPLTRGKLGVVGVRGPVVGLIPAHAGKTSRQADKARVHEAHPRSRGENGGCLPDLLPALGSSPLTRGKHSSCAKFSHVWRLIPAHAGKTVRQYGEGPSLRAHPRSRGENLSESMGVSSDQGSSPLTRGKPGAVWLACAAYGLIPAHAGKTTQHAPPGSRPRAHPRSRGENYRREPLSLADAGSSPLTRGKRSGSPD